MGNNGTNTMSMTQQIPSSLQIDEILKQQQSRSSRWADRFFFWLMIVQFAGLLATAAWISPLTWSGTESFVHQHVWAALIIGGPVTLFPAFMAWRYPGNFATRLSVAIGQMLVSALLIHFTGGRIEAHFHIFGSLAFLAIYRDWRLIIVATLVTAVDHVARSVLWPQSLFGVDQSSILRALEHAGWVIFEDVVLLISIRQSVAETKRLCMTIAEVATCSERVRQSSQKLSVTAEELADGGTEQRTNVGRISTAIEQLVDRSDGIRRIADEVGSSADTARTLAERGEVATRRTDELMQAIESAAREMAAVVGEVQKIAEQTNLLALNATIEASRAGKSGQGFAVVATQVKELASHSRDAAQRVTNLITESIERTTDGVTASRESREHLKEIMASVDSTVGQIREILAATDSQVNAVGDVTRAVETLSSISDRTVTSSDGMASSSRTLQDSAEQLSSIVQPFFEEDQPTQEYREPALA